MPDKNLIALVFFLGGGVKHSLSDIDFGVISPLFRTG